MVLPNRKNINNGASQFFNTAWQYRTLLLMISPAVLYFFLFAYLPMPGIVLAFKEFTYSGGIFKSPWVGFDNFKYFFQSGDALRVTTNTLLYNLAFMTVNMVLQLTVAMMLSEYSGKTYKKIMQSAMFLPYFISWVVVGAFIYNLFNYEFGVLNHLMKNMGMAPVNVYGTTKAWKYILVAFRAWKDVGYGVILYLAAIMGIDQEMYEAAGHRWRERLPENPCHLRFPPSFPP